MADTTHATHTTPTAPATDKTLWKNGAGVGAAIAAALGSLIAVGQGGQQQPPSTDPLVYLIPVAAVSAFALLGALVGAIVGGAVPVVETKTDTQIGIH
jgi:hypothetical protein